MRTLDKARINIDITNHAKERYVERIKGIIDKQEIKRYLSTEDEKIVKEINKLYQYSELIYRGQIGGDKTTKDFMLNNDICLVADNDCIRTIYRINFAFPEPTRLMVINDLKNEIRRLQEEVEEENKLLQEKDLDINTSIKLLELEIKNLQEEIEVKKAEIEANEAIKKANRGNIRLLNRTLQTYAEQLLGNTQYKKDIC